MHVVRMLSTCRLSKIFFLNHRFQHPFFILFFCTEEQKVQMSQQTTKVEMSQQTTKVFVMSQCHKLQKSSRCDQKKKKKLQKLSRCHNSLKESCPDVTENYKRCPDVTVNYNSCPDATTKYKRCRNVTMYTKLQKLPRCNQKKLQESSGCHSKIRKLS